MRYSQKTKSAIEKSADSVPICIQLEVNTEIFVTIRNMLTGLQQGIVSPQDTARISELIRTNSQAIATIEERRGFGIDWPEQIAMLEEAIDIKDRYLSHISLQEIDKSDQDIFDEDPADTYTKEEADQVFAQCVWPTISQHKPIATGQPQAFLIGGQPGSGKSRMAADVAVQFDHQAVHADAANLLGFHPHYQKLQEKYGLYSIYLTQHFADYMCQLAIDRSIREQRHLLLESNLDDRQETLDLLQKLHDAGYYITVMLRACPRVESWTNLQQLYQQQLIKAPSLARIVTQEYHDHACDHFVDTALAIRHSELYDRLIVKSDRGLLYDSEDSPTEDVAELLRERLRRER